MSHPSASWWHRIETTFFCWTCVIPSTKVSICRDQDTTFGAACCWLAVLLGLCIAEGRWHQVTLLHSGTEKSNHLVDQSLCLYNFDHGRMLSTSAEAEQGRYSLKGLFFSTLRLAWHVRAYTASESFPTSMRARQMPEHAWVEHENILHQLENYRMISNPMCFRISWFSRVFSHVFFIYFI